MRITLLREAVRNFLRRETGTQMIEFAIVFPMLLLLFAGTAELGRLFYTYTTLAKATRVGARYLSTVPNVTTSTDAGKRMVLCGNPTSCGGANPKILPNLEMNHVVVTPPVAGASVRYVTVEITGYPYQYLVFNLNAMTGGALTLPALTPRTTMRYMVR